MPAVLSDLVDLVLPRTCVGCARAGAVLCPSCRPGGAPAMVPGHEVPTFAAAPYEFALRAALLRYKERGRRDLAAPLAALLTVAIRAVVHATADLRGPRTVLVPVPSARRAAAARGGDHVLRLARRAAWQTGMPAVPTLTLTRRVADAAGLGAAERAANVHGAMTARPASPGCTAVVVDDIVTTGATLREACRALVAAGWPVAGAAVVAATPAPQRRPPPATGTNTHSHRSPIGNAQSGGLAS